MEPSVSALGISAHEVPHAYQDAEGNRSCRAPRSIGEPLAALSPRLTDAEEEQGVRRVLTAAALTYIVGLFDRLGYFTGAARHRRDHAQVRDRKRRELIVPP